MIPLGLSATDQALFERGLCDDHEIDLRVTILDLEHSPMGIANGRVLSGQVDIDTNSDVDRSLAIELLDTDNSLALADTTPTQVGINQSRMVQVEYGVKSAWLPRWVWVPVFCGPITTVKRSGDTVAITAHGKESLLMGAVSRNLKWPKGSRRTDVIRGLLQAGGETRLEIAARTEKTTVDTIIAPVDALWPRAQGWVRSLGSVRLGYDGRGYAKLSPINPQPVWAFKGGEGGSLLTQPDITGDTSNLRNIVVVNGQDKNNKPVQGVAMLPDSHPFSSRNLGRNGMPRWVREDITGDGISSNAEATALAAAKLNEFNQAAIDAQFNALVIPHLEPWDNVSVVDQHRTWSLPLQKYSIPLTPDGQMTVGRHWVTRSVRGAKR